MQQDPYSIYVLTFGKTASRAKLTDANYGSTVLGRIFRPYGPDGQAAVTIAAQDVTYEGALRTRAEFDEELRRLLS